jgi:hypothetical protein
VCNDGLARGRARCPLHHSMLRDMRGLCQTRCLNSAGGQHGAPPSARPAQQPSADLNAQGACSAVLEARWFMRRVRMACACIPGCGLTLEFTRGTQTAKPAVARRVQRRVSPWSGTLSMQNSVLRGMRRLCQTRCLDSDERQHRPPRSARTAERLGAGLTSQGAC